VPEIPRVSPRPRTAGFGTVNRETCDSNLQQPVPLEAHSGGTIAARQGTKKSSACATRFIILLFLAALLNWRISKFNSVINEMVLSSEYQ